MCHVTNMARHHVNDFSLALDDALDGQQLALQQSRPITLEHRVPDDDVAVAGFVLERHENDPGCGTGPLPASHDTCHFDELILAVVLQVRCAAAVAKRSILSQ